MVVVYPCVVQLFIYQLNDGRFFTLTSSHIGTQVVLDEVAVCQLYRGLCE